MTFLWIDLETAVAEQILSGYGNRDGIHWNFEAHQAVAELMLKALAEAGVPAIARHGTCPRAGDDAERSDEVHSAPGESGAGDGNVVVTITSCRLPADLREQWSIRQVPLHILLDDSTCARRCGPIPDDIHKRHATTAGATPVELSAACPGVGGQWRRRVVAVRLVSWRVRSSRRADRGGTGSPPLN